MKIHPALIAKALTLSWFGFGCIMSNGIVSRRVDSPPPYALNKPLPEPEVFAEGTISTGDSESHPAFTPDGQTLYFLKNSPTFNFWTIVVSHFKNGTWSTPEVAPFSGRYRDADPFITADGSKFFFISDRPVSGKAKGEDGRDLDIWMMEKRGTGWSEPQHLGVPVSSAGSEWYPTVAADGTLYFGSDRPGGKGRTDLYRSRLLGDKYAEPENLGDAINTEWDEFEPYVAPDQSYLIFMAGHPDGLGGYDLYLSYQRGGVWTKPVNLGDRINSSGNEYSPKVSPDGKYFFWTSTRGFGSVPQAKPLTSQQLLTKLRSVRNGLCDIYRIDLSSLRLEH